MEGDGVAKYVDIFKQWLAGWRAGSPKQPPARQQAGLTGKETGRNLLVLGLIGALILLFGRFQQDDVPTGGTIKEPTATSPATSTQQSSAAELALVLSQIAGAGRVDVYITMENGPQQEIAEETSVERTLGTGSANDDVITTRETRRPVTISDDAARTERPILLQQREPQVRGVVVVADGAADVEIRRRLTQAVETALGVSAHRVSVYARSR